VKLAPGRCEQASIGGLCRCYSVAATASKARYSHTLAEPAPPTTLPTHRPPLQFRFHRPPPGPIHHGSITPSTVTPHPANHHAATDPAIRQWLPGLAGVTAATWPAWPCGRCTGAATAPARAPGPVVVRQFGGVALEVSQSGFYAWRSPPPSRRGRSATPGSPIRSARSTPPPGRPGMGVHLVGVQPSRQGVRAGAPHGRRRRLLRQCHDLVILVPHADRAAGPAPLAPASSWPTRSLSTWSCFHNRQRRHSSLGMLSPIEFETRHPTTVA
jgi:hypothetical protein